MKFGPAAMIDQYNKTLTYSFLTQFNHEISSVIGYNTKSLSNNIKFKTSSEKRVTHILNHLKTF